MGTRDPEQPPLWIAASDLPVSPGHPFYTRLNALLDADGFDAFVEDACRAFYAPVLGRPSVAPGRYFRLLLVGYFEGLESERGIAWRAADSLAVRSFVRLGLEEGAFPICWTRTAQIFRLPDAFARCSPSHRRENPLRRAPRNKSGMLPPAAWASDGVVRAGLRRLRSGSDEGARCRCLRYPGRHVRRATA